MLGAIIILGLCLFLLGFGANHLINSSIRLAKYFNVSALLIGLTILAFGTSAPELFLSAMAAINGSGSLSVGNVIGSNIFNLGFILGLSAIVSPILIQKKLVYRDGVFLVFITGIILIMLRDQKVLWQEGLLLLSMLVGYNIFLWKQKDVTVEEDEIQSIPKIKNFIYLFLGTSILSLVHTSVIDGNFKIEIGASIYGSIFLAILVILFSIIMFIPKKSKTNLLGLGLTNIKILTSLGLLVISSHHIVNAAVFIAKTFGVSERAIGATIIAAGTSLPEIAATLVAILKKKYDMGVGNVIGSDIFNILGIIGISSIITPLHLNSTCLFVSNCDNNLFTMLLRDNIFSVMVLFLTLIITFIFMRTGRRISKTEGIILFMFALLRMTFEIQPNFFIKLFS